MPTVQQKNKSSSVEVSHLQLNNLTTHLGYIDGKCYHIWQHHGTYGIYTSTMDNNNQAPSQRRTLLSTTNAAVRRSPQPTLPLAPLAPGVHSAGGASFGPSNFQSKSLLGQQDCTGLIPEVGTCVCCIFYMCLFWGSNVPKQSPTLRTTDRDLFEKLGLPESVQMKGFKWPKSAHPQALGSILGSQMESLGIQRKCKRFLPSKQWFCFEQVMVWKEDAPIFWDTPWTTTVICSMRADALMQRVLLGTLETNWSLMAKRSLTCTLCSSDSGKLKRMNC